MQTMENRITLPEKQADGWRDLAILGYGDDTIYDQAGDLWVIFRDPNGKSKNYYAVKSFGATYTDVVAVFIN